MELLMRKTSCVRCLLQRSVLSTYHGKCLNTASRITLPHKMIEKIEKNKRKEASKRHQKKSFYKGPLMISCKRKEFNHFKGQTYSDFSPQTLASGGWKHQKSVGDYFTLNAYAKNPAVETAPDSRDHVTFESLGVHPKLLEGLSDQSITRPTNIQYLAIPHWSMNKNVLCVAETGSGKTLAYLLPLLQAIHSYREGQFSDDLCNSPYGIIVTPSRELADQIYSVARDVTKHISCDVDVICGGRGTQSLLRTEDGRRMDLLISTPKVLSKLLTNKIVMTARLLHVVLDEADTLLDDSFNELTLRLIRKLKITSEKAGGEEGEEMGVTGTQLSFVGATMPRSLDTILSDTVPLDTIEKVTTSHLHHVLPHVSQKFIRLKSQEKTEAALKVLKNNVKKRVPSLVFCNKSTTANFLGHFLEDADVPNLVLHGNMPEKVRHGRFEQFQTGDCGVLVCTDIASRGLDTVRAQHVMNYDFPPFMSDYIHRVGRVGRVGTELSCHVVSFVSYKWDVELLWRIETAVRKDSELHNVNANIKRKLKSLAEEKLEISNEIHV